MLGTINLLVGLALATSGAGCHQAPKIHYTGHVGFASDVASSKPADQASRVAVIVNDASTDGLEITRFYIQKRHIPIQNVIHVTCPTTQNISDAIFRSEIEAPVEKALQTNPNRIDFLVTIDGMPLTVGPMLLSLDGKLMVMGSTIRGIPTDNPSKIQDSDVMNAMNPYFQKDEPFSHAKFGFYLCTRLDGLNVKDVEAMITKGIEAKPEKGPFLFDWAPDRNHETYGALQNHMDQAVAILKAKGLDATEDKTSTFVGSDKPLMGYVSWGSNDAHFNEQVYHSLKFLPGAISETFVSTSGREFHTQTAGQSRIVDLIQQGVTGVNGYVSEPYTFSMCWVNILFNRYTEGLNLAESMYASLPVLVWKNVVIGDPLCAPYASAHLAKVTDNGDLGSN